MLSPWSLHCQRDDLLGVQREHETRVLDTLGERLKTEHDYTGSPPSAGIAGDRLSLSRRALRTTNTIERLHEEFRRRVKTQGSRPSEDAALVLLFSLVASGQIKLRRIDGWRKIAAVVSRHLSPAAA